MVLDTLIEALANNIMAMMPFVVVKSYERGVRWTLGKEPKELLPGFHWRVYLVHEVQTIIVVDDVVEIPVQSVITQDEKLVCFSTAIGYRITDVVSHLNNVTDFSSSTIALARQHLARRVRNMNLSDLIAGLNDLEASLKATLTTRFKSWGTEVFSVGFTDFAEVPTQVRLFIDPILQHKE